MKKTEATPMDCLICYCPYCGKEVIETGCDMRDITGWDFEEETEINCPYCKKTFLAVIKD